MSNEQPQVNYAEFVAKLAKDGKQIQNDLTGPEAHSVHMIMGLAGEVGELLDAIKKSVIYRKPLDLENVREELGDIEFYLQGLRNGFNLNRQDILEQNVAKLQKRYSKGYSNQAAQERADKQ